jgi:hypothetical protein
MRISDEARVLLHVRLARIIHDCRREIASKPGEERVARGEREDILSGHPLASSPVPFA